MSEFAVRIEQVSKRYRIGQLRRSNYSTLRDQISDVVSRPIKRIAAQLRREEIAESEAPNHIWALKDVSFNVNHGEVVGVVGHNGAGKSTLLKILSRITTPTSGRIEAYGRVGSLLEVGTGFHPELTGRENIYLNGAILGMRRGEIRRKFDEIVEFAEVEKFIDTPVKFYSSGMYVRLAFAVAAHLEPEILVIDEVLAVGDARFQKKCLGKMGDVAREGRTVVFVSHNMPTVANLCQRVVLLRGGQLLEVGPTAKVIDHYLTEAADVPTDALRDRTDRHGRGDVRATALELLNPQGSLIQSPLSGSTLTMRLHYSGQPGREFRNCNMSIIIFRDERPYVVLSTDLVDSRQIDIEGDGYVDFIVPNLPLSAGNYSLTSYIGVNSEMQDYVQHAAELSVIDGDFFGTGRAMLPGWHGQVIMVKHHWSLDRDPATQETFVDHLTETMESR
jgi:lipopolysaccharide transport system ATP-binding protein